MYRVYILAEYIFYTLYMYMCVYMYRVHIYVFVYKHIYKINVNSQGKHKVHWGPRKGFLWHNN